MSVVFASRSRDKVRRPLPARPAHLQLTASEVYLTRGNPPLNLCLSTRSPGSGSGSALADVDHFIQIGRFTSLDTNSTDLVRELAT